jgi:hypothetical protein
MLRFALSAAALVAVLAMAQAVFADPLAATASDYAQTAADAIVQPAWSGHRMRRRQRMFSWSPWEMPFPKGAGGPWS